MSISSSLNASVMGLGVNATRLSAISDNIANSATNGYKRTKVDFSSLVNGGSDTERYAAGGVRASAHRDVSAQGALLSTSNSTDLAISGRGLLAVTNVDQRLEPSGERPLMLTSTGSFSQDDDGYLRTASGLQLLGWPIVDGEIGAVARESQTDLVPVRLDGFDFSPNKTTEAGMAVNLPANATAGDTYNMSIDYFDALGARHKLSMVYTSVDPALNSWNLTINDSGTGGVIGDFAMTFASNDDPAAVPPLSAGGLDSVTPATGTYDATTGMATITGVAGDIQLEIGAIGATTNLTQFAGDFAPVSVSQNGSILGVVDRIEINSDGIIEGIYDTGFRRSLFQIPIVDVPNPNGLQPVNNQAFTITEDSGPFYLWDAGAGPTGDVLGYTVEQSTVDITQELTQLIETQRAYSSNAKIVQTVDEMLQETNNLKR